MIPFNKILYSIYLDYIWISTNKIPVFGKFIYIPNKYISLLLNSRSIIYLGRTFKYDNVNTPATLQSYPSELLRVGRYVDLLHGTVLDIGANVGQTIVTLKAFYPDCRIIGVEANPEIFETLQSNVSDMDNVEVINLAVGPAEKKNFYYVPGFSGKGSFIKENAELNISSVRSKEIGIVSNPFSSEFCARSHIPARYDLIKIDVEGYELSVIKNIVGIKTKALYIEFSNNREPRYSLLDLFDSIRAKFGKFKIQFCDEITPDTTMGNILVTFEE